MAWAAPVPGLRAVGVDGRAAGAQSGSRKKVTNPLASRRWETWRAYASSRPRRRDLIPGDHGPKAGGYERRRERNSIASAMRTINPSRHRSTKVQSAPLARRPRAAHVVAEGASFATMTNATMMPTDSRILTAVACPVDCFAGKPASPVSRPGLGLGGEWPNARKVLR